MGLSCIPGPCFTATPLTPAGNSVFAQLHQIFSAVAPVFAPLLYFYATVFGAVLLIGIMRKRYLKSLEDKKNREYEETIRGQVDNSLTQDQGFSQAVAEEIYGEHAGNDISVSEAVGDLDYQDKLDLYEIWKDSQ